MLLFVSVLEVFLETGELLCVRKGRQVHLQSGGWRLPDAMHVVREYHSVDGLRLPGRLDGGRRWVTSPTDDPGLIPVASDAASVEDILRELETTKVPERAGRALDHETEDAFERLRVSGYL